MTTLIQIPEDFKSEFKVDIEGKITASIRGTARLADVKHSSLIAAFKSSGSQKRSSLAKYLIEYGFEGGAQNSWLDSGIPGIAVNAILEYYGYECQPRYRKEQAKILCRAFRNYGYQKWFQEQLGWQPAQEIQKPLTIEEMFAKQAQINLDHARKQELLFDRTNLHGEKLNEIVDEINILKRAYVSNTDAVNNYIHDMQQQHNICKAIVASDAPQDYKDRELVKYGIIRFSEFSGKSISTSYNTAYTELKLRTGFDVFTKATKKGTQKIDEVEKAGYMKELHLIVNYMLNSLSKSTYGEVTIEDILYNFF